MPERRGHAETRTRVLISGTRRGLTPKLIADLRRQSAIEPEIGHMKTDGRLTRCTLKGSIGDALFAALCACGHNIRKILAHLRSWLVWIVAAILNAAFPRIASVSLSHQPERIVQGQRDRVRSD